VTRAKRTFDILAAGAGLVLLSPLLGLVALLVKSDDGGPVFFRQERVGYRGRPFRIWKFRSMAPDAAARGLPLTVGRDTRVTRIGAWLRRLKLDELPQLFNIISGQMSLVGPRPLVIEEDQRIEGWHRRRLELMPGMTGPWQILGPARVPLKEMVTIDYLYIANWSLWKDVKILMRTVPHVLGGRGL